MAVCPSHGTQNPAVWIAPTELLPILSNRHPLAKLLQGTFQESGKAQLVAGRNSQVSQGRRQIDDDWLSSLTVPVAPVATQAQTVVCGGRIMEVFNTQGPDAAVVTCYGVHLWFGRRLVGNCTATFNIIQWPESTGSSMYNNDPPLPITRSIRRRHCNET